MEELRQRVGDKLTEHISVQRRGTQKVMAEHDKLGKNLAKEHKENARLAKELAEKQLAVSKLEKHVSELETRLTDVLSEKPNYDKMDADKYAQVMRLCRSCVRTS